MILSQFCACSQTLLFGKWEYQSSTFTKFVQTYTVNCHSAPKVHLPWILGHWTNTAWLLALNQARFDTGSTEKSRNHCLQLRISQSQTISCFLKHASSPNFGCQIFWFYRSSSGFFYPMGMYWILGERRKAAFIARLFFPPWGTLIHIQQKGTRG